MTTNTSRLRVLSWNINGGLWGDDSPAGPPSQSAGTSYVGRSLAKLKADLVALQEVDLPAVEGPLDQVQRIAAAAGYAYHCELRLSPSHHVNGETLGLAILSRLEILGTKSLILPNANMELTLGDGSVIQSHDKGLLAARVATPAGELWLVCGHLPPFHRFGREPNEPDFSTLWTDLGAALVELAALPLVACIDLNINQLSQPVPKQVHLAPLRTLLHGPTRPTGEGHDQIFCTRHWLDAETKILPSNFDHHVCLVDLSLSPTREEIPDPPSVKAPKTKTYILHLSDLHFGEGEHEDVDWKTFLTFAARESRRDRLAQFLRALPQVPDHVVISGDLTIAGRDGGFVEFDRFMDDLMASNALPEANRIVVVPGNHDVQRVSVGGADRERDRWKAFLEHVGDRFARPWIPSCDAPVDEILSRLEKVLDGAHELWGGVSRRPVNRLGKAQAWPFPFLWDRARRVLFYAFNSASISGSRIEVEAEVEEAIGWLRDWNDPNRDKVQRVVDALQRELEVDPARIDPREIALFSAVMRCLRHRAPSELKSAFKVAVLHHHVSPVLGEEVKKFELLLNAGRFKRELREEGFQVILHGHKHWPEVLLDAVLPGEEPQCVISGGTIGGSEALGRRPGFFFLEHSSEESTLVARFVTLTESGNVERAIESASVTTLRVPVIGGLSRAEPADPGVLISLGDLYRQTEKALLSHLQRLPESGGREWVGWSHHLSESRVSTIATAYGLRILKLIQAQGAALREVLPEILASLIAMRLSDGGWSASSQSGLKGQPEATIFALSALYQWNAMESLAVGLATLDQILDPEVDPVLWRYIFSVATVGRLLAEVEPRSPWLARISEALCGAAFRDEGGRVLWWSRHTLRSVDEVPVNSSVRGSIIHTAHAIMALSRIHRATDGQAGLKPDNLRAAASWLLSAHQWENSTEDINRLVSPGKYTALVVKHFTLPWVIIALLEAGTPPEHPRVRAAVRELLAAQDDGLWNWGTLEKPIWATHDALSALTAVALAGARA